MQCADALCDDWFWPERLTCWNWGYGGLPGTSLLTIRICGAYLSAALR